MRMFNADGSESEMCGNGIRCVAKFVYDHGIAAEAVAEDRNRPRRARRSNSTVNAGKVRQRPRRHGRADSRRRQDSDDAAGQSADQRLICRRTISR